MAQQEDPWRKMPPLRDPLEVVKKTFGVPPDPPVTTTDEKGNEYEVNFASKNSTAWNRGKMLRSPMPEMEPVVVSPGKKTPMRSALDKVKDPEYKDKIRKFINR